jgi:hypothetical protein
MSQWLLLVMLFVGPTSPDQPKVERFETEEECKAVGKSKYRWASWTCFPVARIDK